MTNIREEKGYTYGVYSMLVTMQHSGYMFISSETGSNVTEAAIKEVYKEIDRLCNNEVPSKELMHVKNYMIGALLRKTDGPFEQIDRYKEMVEYGFTFDYLKDYISYIKQVQPETLLDLAQKYLQANTLSELVVGT
jgi:predicted Zn-dependent peptidase